jgi:hypothetical protein
MALIGGEGGIRTRHSPLDSVTYRFYIARNARNAIHAGDACTLLHAACLSAGPPTLAHAPQLIATKGPTSVEFTHRVGRASVKDRCVDSSVDWLGQSTVPGRRLPVRDDTAITAGRALPCDPLIGPQAVFDHPRAGLASWPTATLDSTCGLLIGAASCCGCHDCCQLFRQPACWGGKADWQVACLVDEMTEVGDPRHAIPPAAILLSAQRVPVLVLRISRVLSPKDATEVRRPPATSRCSSMLLRRRRVQPH